MSKELTWKEAIIKVLQDAGAPMHYADISQAILDQGLRKPTATPAKTVAANITSSLMKGPPSPFKKFAPSIYGLAHMEASVPDAVAQPDGSTQPDEEMGLINAFGMFWSRDQVMWDPTDPALLGVQQAGSKTVNFANQAGVYILYDGSRPIYVGRVTEPRMGKRLRDHTRDRLTGRWDRFSWFGVRGVRENGTLSAIPSAELAVTELIATMEALLIEGLEPPQNRKQGDGFKAVEFIQETDPKLLKAKQKDMLQKLLEQAGM